MNRHSTSNENTENISHSNICPIPGFTEVCFQNACFKQICINHFICQISLEMLVIMFINLLTIYFWWLYFTRPKSLALSTPSQLRVTPQSTQKYIDVGGGPANLPPTYHTIIQLPGGSFKHKKSSAPWKNIFFKVSKK